MHNTNVLPQRRPYMCIDEIRFTVKSRETMTPFIEKLNLFQWLLWQLVYWTKKWLDLRYLYLYNIAHSLTQSGSVGLKMNLKVWVSMSTRLGYLFFSWLISVWRLTEHSVSLISDRGFTVSCLFSLLFCGLWGSRACWKLHLQHTVFRTLQVFIAGDIHKLWLNFE